MDTTELAPTAALGPLEPPSTDLAAGPQLLLERYRVGSRLGSGGFGTVWEGFDTKLERTVAIKEVETSAKTPRRRRRADREARAVARLAHPNIVSLYEYCNDGERSFLITEIVHGNTVDELASGGGLTDRAICQIGLEVCSGLAHAHAHGVIHRDIKPQNIIVSAPTSEDEGYGPAKLMDFGIAQIVDEEKLTATGDLVGTLAYMAPEQAHGEPVDEAADLYSLALTLYEAWSGSNPMRAASPAALVKKLGRAAPSLGRARPDLPPALTETVDAALDPDPRRRVLLQEFSAVLEDVVPELDGDQPIEPKDIGLEVRLPNALAQGALPLVLSAAVLGGSLFYNLDFGPATALVAVAASSWFIPRLAWSILSVLLVAAVARSDSGVAVALVSILAPTLLLLWRHPRLLVLPALAPCLGFLGIATGYLGVVALVRSVEARLALALLGFWALAIAELISGSSHLYSQPLLASNSGWQSSASDTVSIFGSALSSEQSLTALLWAGLALSLPFVVRGRHLLADLAGGALWTTVLISASGAIGYAATGSRGLNAGLVVGAVASVLVTALLKAAGRRSETLRGL